MPTRVCLACGQPTAKPSSKGLCPSCQATYEAARPARAVYDDPAWRRYRARVLAGWVRRNGYTCPGWGVPRHRAYDLTVDHPVALAAGGAAFPRNPGVLCRACNGRKANQPATARPTP